MTTPRAPLLGIVGPTASGKESAALHVAPLLGAEIISLDSMKVYVHMDIGTAKASASARRQVPHHMVDIVQPSEAFNVREYVDRVDSILAELAARGKTGLLSGGTSLYLKALLYGLSAPGDDPEIRGRLEREADELGLAALHERLRRVDPEAGERIHPNDRRRIVRALEVHQVSGRPISSFQTDFNRSETRYPVTLVGIRRDRADLHRRIDRRIDQMFADGLVEEVRRIRDGGGFGRQAAQALGYKEVLEHLDGKRDLDSTRERLCFATHQFARHQMTWLRRFEAIRWVDVEPEESAESIATRTLAELRRPLEPAGE